MTFPPRQSAALGENVQRRGSLEGACPLPAIVQGGLDAGFGYRIFIAQWSAAAQGRPEKNFPFRVDVSWLINTTGRGQRSPGGSGAQQVTANQSLFHLIKLQTFWIHSEKTKCCCSTAGIKSTKSGLFFHILFWFKWQAAISPKSPAWTEWWLEEM